MNTNAEKNQKVFDTLSELEEFFYYKMQNPEELAGHFEDLTKLHEEARFMLRRWHELTGCVNQ